MAVPFVRFDFCMTFFSLLCALLLEQLHPLSPGNQAWRIQQRLADWALDNLGTGKPAHGWIAWTVTVATPALAAFLIYRALMVAGWPLALVWNVLMVYLSVGYRQFSDPIAAIRVALEQGDEIRARQLLNQWKDKESFSLSRYALAHRVLKHTVLDVHRRLFGVVAAFVLFSMLGLGPAGAVLYRCADFAAGCWQQRREQAGLAASSRALQTAQQAWQWINWLPVRMTAASFAIVRNFEQAVDNWRQTDNMQTNDKQEFDPDETMLLAVAAGAIGIADDSGTWDPPKPSAPQAGPTQIPSTMQDPTQSDDAGVEYGARLPAPAKGPEMPPLHLLGRLIWRGLLLWGMLIALVTVTHWIS